MRIKGAVLRMRPCKPGSGMHGTKRCTSSLANLKYFGERIADRKTLAGEDIRAKHTAKFCSFLPEMATFQYN